MKALIFTLVTLMSLAAFSDSDKGRKDDRKDDKRELKGHPKPLSVFDVIPLNSPVKESSAKFLLKVPNGFEIDEVKFKVKNASRLFDKDKSHEKINLIDGPQGKELHFSVSKLPLGFYQLFVKIRDRKNKEHEFKTKFKDHAMFVIDNSLEVPVPNAKENEKTVAGIDSDNDGVRDDVQRWINESYSTQPKVRLALRQIAMSMQLQFLIVNDKAKSILVSKKQLNDSNCMKYILGIEKGVEVRTEVETRMLNTKDRHYAEIKANGNFSGQSLSLKRNAEDRKAACLFDPDQI